MEGRAALVTLTRCGGSASPASMTSMVDGADADAIASAPRDGFALEVFYDGACPLCAREIALLRRLDRRRRIRFVDIAVPAFDAAAVGVSWAALMGRMHARLPDGTLVTGAEVFRLLYASVGCTRLVALSRVPGVRWLVDRGYELFARYRLTLTGRRCDQACAPAGERQTDRSRLGVHD
jgi:predicted DCC family thiol-disulfide oxidoreductase YuxK